MTDNPSVFDIIDIAGLDKTELLCALYDGGHKLGLGRLAGDVTHEDIAAWVERWREPDGSFPRVDYLGGRPLKVNLADDTFSAWLYDRDNGQGEARRIVDELRTAKAI